MPRSSGTVLSIDNGLAPVDRLNLVQDHLIGDDARVDHGVFVAALALVPGLHVTRVVPGNWLP